MIREAKEEDLYGILELYTNFHDNPMRSIDKDLLSLWKTILNNKGYYLVVAQADDKIVSSCVIVVIENLTHAQRPYAIIENVVTDISYRKKGYASACLNYAKEIALKNNCYKIMLMTGSKEESTLRFYEQAGYNRNDKTAFIQWF
jgi:ribosomal protein S18 acetylase RimI-like enzyme